MLDRQGYARQRSRRPGSRSPASSSTTQWLLAAVLVLVGLIVLGRLRASGPATPTEVVTAEVEMAADTVAPAAAPAPPAQSAPPAAVPAPAATPTLDLLVRLEARRRMQRAGGAVYLDTLLAETDSVLRRWPERPGQPITVAIVRDSLFDAAGAPDQPVREAFDRWGSLRLGVDFAFIADTNSADIVVSWRDRFAPEERRTGQTELQAAPDGTIQQARISLAIRGPDGSRLPRPATLITAVHEAGHAIGLAHSDRPGDVMHPTPQSPALSDRDRQTALLIYGLPAGSVKGQ
ncbi:MAG TPA: matrixin family metalloprotease [Gemmatimonadales bacterium]|nr:matrixin family metalloprotease [Gemmatimonadales bacterium]